MDYNENPSAWFDQFNEYAEQNPQGNPQWCMRHWAPCPAMGANGMMAAIDVLMHITDEITAERSLTPGEMNLAAEVLEPWCCHLGDEVMYEIWGKCPPSFGGQPPEVV
jgi:hypothetical protein